MYVRGALLTPVLEFVSMRGPTIPKNATRKYDGGIVQLVNSKQCYRFVSTNLNKDGMLALRMHIGPIFRIFTGMPTGASNEL